MSVCNALIRTVRVYPPTTSPPHCSQPSEEISQGSTRATAFTTEIGSPVAGSPTSPRGGLEVLREGFTDRRVPSVSHVELDGSSEELEEPVDASASVGFLVRHE